MEGGIRAWDGLVSEKIPETGWFLSAESPERALALAWIVEEGTRRFYQKVAEGMEDPGAGDVFSALARAEIGHQKALSDQWLTLTGDPLPADFPSEVLESPPEEGILEQGMRLHDALQWMSGKTAREILEFSISLETAAYDRYLRMVQEAPGEEIRALFLALSAEERAHLHRLSAMLDDMLQSE